MSKEALAKVVQRAISDGEFRRQLSTDPTGALRGFELTDDEMRAVRTGDAGRLSALGVDQRMSKAFTLGGSDSVGSTVTTGDAGISGGSLSNAIATGDPGLTGSTVNSAIVTGGTNDSDALVGGDASQLGNAMTSGDETTQSFVSSIPRDPDLGHDALVSDPAHAFGAVTGGGDPSLGNVLTSGDDAASNAFTLDGDAGGASSTGETTDGPEISQ